MKFRQTLLALSGLTILLAFNNCSQMKASIDQTTNNSSTSGNSDDPPSPSPVPNPPAPTPTPTPSPQPQNKGWSHEPAGSLRAVDCEFNTSDCAGQVKSGTFIDWGAKSYNYPAPIVIDPTVLSGNSKIADAFLRFTGICNVDNGKTFASCGTGGSVLAWYNNAGTREIYFGAYFKINADYSSSLVGSSKIFFLRTAENKFGAPDTNGVFLIRGRDQTRQMVFAHNTGGLDNSHTCGEGGATCFPNSAGSGTFTRGNWVKFEACVRASTSVTSQDGVVRWWVDGQLAGDYRNMNYGSLVANEWVWNQTWDGYGNGQGFTTDTHQYLDHLVVSVPPNGGCAAAN